MNAMKELHVEKVVVNIGVGEAGERLSKASTKVTSFNMCKQCTS